MPHLSAQENRRDLWAARLALLLACTVWQLSAALPVAVAKTATKSPPTGSATSQRFRVALGLYQAGKYAEAQAQLKPLLASNPNSFENNELNGLIYVALGQDEKANPFLAKAVRINANVPEARTTLAANLMRLHRAAEAESHLRKLVEIAPKSYDANHNLGELYIQLNRLPQAIPFLKRAAEINPGAYNNGYDLALAYEQTGDLNNARRQLEELIKTNDTAELHSLLGEVEEKDKNYLASAAHFEKAVHIDPSENNIYEWGTELLLHQTFEPALEVFKAGLVRFPQSSRLTLGFGVATYGLGDFAGGAEAFLRASELNPADSLPLVLLGKGFDNLPASFKDKIIARFDQFVKTHRDASVSYYYAMALWRQGGDTPAETQATLVQNLLESAVSIDPNLLDAHLQMGILYASQRKYNEAISQYEQALKIDCSAAAVHYRLGQSLARSGAAARSKEEFALFERLRAQETDAANKKSAEIQQFVYTLRDSKVNE
jgi:tetratricopeptide (TPR) repeat protein